MQLHLKVVVIPEHFLMPFYGLFGSIHVSCIYQPRDFSGNAGRAAYQVRGIFLHHFMRHSRAVVHAFYMAGGHYLHQILVSVVVLGEQDQMEVALVLRVLQMVVIVPCHVYLASYYRLYPRMLFRELVELLDTVHVPVVGDGDSRHPQFFGPVEKGFYGRKSVSDRVLRMDVKMNE